MFFEYEGKKYKVALQKASPILYNADENIKSAYKISPSGYGIHWPLIDEDLSFNALVKIAEAIIE